MIFFSSNNLNLFNLDCVVIGLKLLLFLFGETGRFDAVDVSSTDDRRC